MGLPAIIAHDGALTGSAAPGGSTGSLMDLIRTSFQATYNMCKTSRPSIVGASDGSPFIIPLETITRVRLIVLRVRGGSLKVKITSAVGTLQAFNVDDIFMLHNPNSGSEITAIQLVGNADVEYLVAGDTA